MPFAQKVRRLPKSFAIKYIEEPRSLIPERYGDPKRSKLVAEVFADEPNSFAFGLLTP
jgi:hypothetical protein